MNNSSRLKKAVMSDELHLALQKCKEIRSSQTLYEFVKALPGSFGRDRPCREHAIDFDSDQKMRTFSKSVIICKTINYRDE